MLKVIYPFYKKKEYPLCFNKVCSPISTKYPLCLISVAVFFCHNFFLKSARAELPACNQV